MATDLLSDVPDAPQAPSDVPTLPQDGTQPPGPRDLLANVPDAPAAVSAPREAVRGFNRGVLRLLDVLTSPVTVPAQAFGLDIGRPFTRVGERVGITAPPTTETGAAIQRVGESTGMSTIPGMGLTGAGVRAVTPVVAPVVRATANRAQALLERLRSLAMPSTVPSVVARTEVAPILRAAGARPGAFTAAETAAGVTGGIGAEVGQEIGGDVGGVAGGVAGGITPSAVSGGARALLRGRPGATRTVEEVSPASGALEQREVADDIAARVAAAERAGTSLSASQAGGQIGGQLAEATIFLTPGGNVVARTFGARQAENLANRVRDISTRLAGGQVPSPTQAGATMRQGVDDFVTRFRARSEQAFNDLDQFVPAATPVQMDDVVATLDDLTRATPGAEATSALTVNPKIVPFVEAVAQDVGQTGTMPYRAVRELRSRIRRITDNPGLHADQPVAELQQVYRALTRAMKATADAAGPRARTAFDRANRIYARGKGFIDDELTPLVRSTITDEQVFTAFEKGGKEGATKLNRLRTALTRPQWETVVSTVINRMGRARASSQGAAGDRFSVDTFLTSWNNISAEGKRALFSNRRLRRDMNDIATTVEAIKDGAGALRNPSGTAERLVNISAAASGLSAVASGNLSWLTPLIGGMVSSAGAAALMTSPQFVRWLARSTRIPVGQTAAHLERLGKLAESNPALTEPIGEYLQGIQFDPVGAGQLRDLPASNGN